MIEAESWGWHADQQTHSRDCVRFTLLTVAGWRVLRFTWEQVMHSPAFVRRVLAQIIEPDSAARVATRSAPAALMMHGGSARNG